MADCIDARITANLLAALATITTDDENPVEYNTNVETVSLARKIDRIEGKNYCLVIPNEPDPEFDDTVRGDQLEYLVWFLDGEDDESGDPFTYRLRNVQADFLKAIRINPSRIDEDGVILAQNTTMGAWDYGLYFDSNGVAHEGVYMYIRVNRMLDPDDPYTIAL